MADTTLTTSSDLTPQVEAVLKVTKVIPLHTHNGTDSLQIGTASASGQNTIQGPVRLEAGQNISLSQDGNTITISNTETSSNTQSTFAAAETIAAGAAVASTLYQAALISLDTKGIGNVTTSTNVSITIGNNLNRVLVFMFVSTNGGGSFETLATTYNGTNIPLQQTNFVTAGNHYSCFTGVLGAPTIGTNNLTIAPSGSGVYAYYSVYNASTGSVNSANSTTGTSTSVSVTTNVDGMATFGLITNISSSVGTGGGNVFTADTQTFNGGPTPTALAGDSGLSIQYPMGSVMTLSNSGASNNTQNSAIIAINPATAAIAGVENASSAASNGRSSAFIGFNNTSVTVGQTATVTTAGVATGLSSIQTGVQYYLNDTNGTIGTSQGSVTRKVGIGTSDTSLAITNIW